MQRTRQKLIKYINKLDNTFPCSSYNGSVQVLLTYFLGVIDLCALLWSIMSSELPLHEEGVVKGVFQISRKLNISFSLSLFINMPGAIIFMVAYITRHATVHVMVYLTTISPR